MERDGGRLVTVAAKVAPDLRRELEARARAEDRPLSSVIRRALMQALRLGTSGAEAPGPEVVGGCK
jgi:hypothetical protein